MQTWDLHQRHSRTAHPEIVTKKLTAASRLPMPDLEAPDPVTHPNSGTVLELRERRVRQHRCGELPIPRHIDERHSPAKSQKLVALRKGKATSRERSAAGDEVDDAEHQPHGDKEDHDRPVRGKELLEHAGGMTPCDEPTDVACWRRIRRTSAPLRTSIVMATRITSPKFLGVTVVSHSVQSHRTGACSDEGCERK